MEISKHLLKEDILYAYSGGTNGELQSWLNVKRSHTVRKVGSITACLLDFVLLSLKQTGFLLITAVCVCLLVGFNRPTSSSINMTDCVCGISHGGLPHGSLTGSRGQKATAPLNF